MLDQVAELLRGGNGATLSARLAVLERRLAELEGQLPAGDAIASPPTVVSLTAKLASEIEAHTWTKLVAELLRFPAGKGLLELLGAGSLAEIETLKARKLKALSIEELELLEVLGRLQAVRFNTKPAELAELTESPKVIEPGGGAGAEVWLKSNKEIEVTGVTLGTPAVLGGDQVTLYNMRTNAFNIVLVNESGVEVVTKRFRIKGGNFTLEPGMAAKFTYRQSRFVLDTRS